MTQTLQLHVDILRGRNYPQTEDDPCPCTTMVRLVPYDMELKETVANPFTSDLQKDSNAPFYNANAVFGVPSELECVVLLIEVTETTRQKTPYTMFFASQLVPLEAKGKHEEVLFLIKTNPIKHPEDAAIELRQAAEDVASCPQLSIRYHVQRAKASLPKVVDAHADVSLRDRPSFTGDQNLVPEDAQYVWFNLTSDPRWMEAFRSELVRDWRGRPPLVAPSDASPEGAVREKRVSLVGLKQTSAVARRRSTVMGNLPDDVRTIADVVLKKWCCRRSHEVLTRLRYSAEAFNRGERSLHFTREVETSCRLQHKERVYLLQELAINSLSNIGHCPLRDLIDRLWILFVTGIKHEISDTRVLPQDARRRVNEAAFTSEDAAVLQSSLLRMLVPSLSLEQCDQISAEDTAALATAAVPPANGNGNGNGHGNGHGNGNGHGDDDGEEAMLPERHMVPVANQCGNCSPPPAEVAFTLTLIEYIGAMMDTLTTVELMSALRAFEPAVLNAHQRIIRGEKESLEKTIRTNIERRREGQVYKPRGGIKIDHLDILGRRTKEVLYS